MPQEEFEKLIKVNRFLKLRISKEKELQEIVELAASICETSYARINFVDHGTQSVKFSVGVPIAEASYEFYAESPLTTEDGLHMGTLCVFDLVAKQLNSLQIRMLQSLSRQVICLLEFDGNLQLLKDQFITSRNSETKLRAFFESSSSCHLLLDPQLKIISFNKAMVDFLLTNVQLQFAESMDISDYVHPDYLAAFESNCSAALKGESLVEEVSLNYPTGKCCWYISFDPARDPDGEIIGVSYNATDITKRVEHEVLLGQQNESIQKIAHLQDNELDICVRIINTLMNTIMENDSAKQISEIQLMNDSVKELSDKSRRV